MRLESKINLKFLSLSENTVSCVPIIITITIIISFFCVQMLYGDDSDLGVDVPDELSLVRTSFANQRP